MAPPSARRDLSGAVVATGVTNRNGMVFFERLQAPADFRAVATLPGFAGELRAEMRGFDQARQQVRISPLTDLVSRYLDSNPGVSPAEAESRVKRTVQVPGAVSVSIGLEEPNPVFSDLALLRVAGQNGGWIALRTALVGQARNGVGRPYWLGKSVLNRPITGLEVGLQEVAEASRVRLQRRLKIPDATPQTLSLAEAVPTTWPRGPRAWRAAPCSASGRGWSPT